MYKFLQIDVIVVLHKPNSYHRLVNLHACLRNFKLSIHVYSNHSIWSKDRYPKTYLLPPCLDIGGQMENIRHDISDTQVGFLMAITGHSQVPPEGGAFRHR
ncbi:hypothetical protein AVEN_39839-1 [Araneus ventricosus]|uniref:Uncharacterized protein n=1 Tax=Araneus ventricosus TaxID=182803 RepID=A0A4Y2S333_ARAVE|nr:hypothetical protein AVEN_39839-1 [Araneus ventricosus]